MPGMIQPLSPVPAACFCCPTCSKALSVDSWYMPGMWCLAQLHCPNCHGRYYGTLQEGHSLFHPVLINRSSGEAYDRNTVGATWFRDLLKKAFRSRSSREIPLHVRGRTSGERELLLINCLDNCFGHSLPKLLSAQYYLEHHSRYDIAVIVPRALEWLIPDGIAEAWIVDAPLSELGGWYDALAGSFAERITQQRRVSIAAAPATLHRLDYDISRFTRIRPFDVSRTNPQGATKITFVWRDDRVAHPVSLPVIEQGLARLQYRAPNYGREIRRRLQHSHFERIAKELRARIPNVDLAVAGLGRPGGFPEWIKDLRSPFLEKRPEPEWCRRYAESHLVIGVHGSNMMLASALAGAALILLPEDRLGLSFTDTILNDPRGGHPNLSTLLRYRMLPSHTKASTVAEWASSMIQSFPVLMDIWNAPRLETPSPSTGQ